MPRKEEKKMERMKFYFSGRIGEKRKTKIITFLVFWVLITLIVVLFGQMSSKPPLFFKENGINVGGAASYPFTCRYLEVKDLQYVSTYHREIETVVETQEGLFTFYGKELIKSGLWVYYSYELRGKVYRVLITGPLAATADSHVNNDQLKKEIEGIVKKGTLKFMESDTEEVTLHFLINAQNELVIFDATGDNEAACAHVKERLDYKQVKFKQARQLTPYEVNIKFVRDVLE